MTTERKRKFLIDSAYFGLVVAIVYFLIKYTIGYIFPFFLGALIALIVRPIIVKLNKWFKINKKFLAVVILLIFYALTGVAVTFLTIRLIKGLNNFFATFPDLFETSILPVIENVLSKIEDLIASSDFDLLGILNEISGEIVSTLTGIVKTVSTNAISSLTNLITSIPKIIIAFLFTIISSFFMAIDFDQIINFFKLQLSPRGEKIVTVIKESFSQIIFQVLKAYALIMTMTFIELAIGLTILKIPNAIVVALIIAMIDILPILGTGGVMIPWFIIEFINGNISLGIGLAIIYIVVTAIRNIVEPKIVGDQIGLYPLLTLFTMFLGAKIFGVIGLFGLPIATTIIIRLQKAGVISLYKEVSEESK